MKLLLRSTLLIALLLTGCGFHLKDTDVGVLPTRMHVLSDDAALMQVVSQHLQVRGTQVVQVTAAELVYPLLELEDTERSRRPLVLDQAGRPTRFNLQISTRFRFSPESGEYFFIPLQISKAIDSDVDQSTAADQLEQSTWQYLLQSMSSLILTQLSYLSASSMEQ